MNGYEIIVASLFGMTIIVWTLIMIITQSKIIAITLAAPIYTLATFWSLSIDAWWDMLPLIPIVIAVVWLLYKLLAGKNIEVNNETR